MDLDTARWVAALRLPAALVFCLTTPAGAAVTGAEMDAEGWIKFDSSQGQISFNVAVNDTPAVAILDTGAEVTTISRRLVELSGIESLDSNAIKIIGVLGQGNEKLSKKFDLHIGNVAIPLGKPAITGQRCSAAIEAQAIA